MAVFLCLLCSVVQKGITFAVCIARPMYTLLVCIHGENYTPLLCIVHNAHT